MWTRSKPLRVRLLGAFQPDFDPLDLRDIQHAKAAVYYIEVQFLGGLSTDLIDQIAFRERPSLTLRTLLRERGIRWFTLPWR